MIVIPQDKAVFKNLNSYYLDIKKLIEHFQGELGSGGIYFHAPSSQGAVFFDKDEILNSLYLEKDGEIDIISSIEYWVEAAVEQNFALTICKLEPEEAYFWANIPTAKRIYQDLSTEFTDLEGLIKKMCSERLSGYIEIVISKGERKSFIFFNKGENIGGFYFWENGMLSDSGQNLNRLIDETKADGGTFHVSGIPLKNESVAAKSDTAAENDIGKTVRVLEALLVEFEKIVSARKQLKGNFTSLLKKKLIEKADKFTFLDPFAAEFEYSGKKINFTGKASARELSQGVLESMKELANELGITNQLREATVDWSRKYSKEIGQCDIAI